jgi:hypothetical protein
MNSEVALAAYPVRPHPVPSESLAGYLSRFHFANGVAAPTWTRRTAAELRRGAVPGQDRPWWRGTHLAVSVDGLVDRYRKVRTALARSLSADWLKQPVAALFCPLCIRECELHLAVFELPLCSACPVHELVLLNRCTACRASLAWGKVRLGWHCACGQAIARMPTVAAMSWQVHLAFDLEHALTRAADDEGEGLRALYASIGWANQLKRQLATTRDDPGAVLAEDRMSARTRWAPNRWEVVLLKQTSRSLARRGARLLRLLCRRLEPPLVDTSAAGRLEETLQILSRLQHLPHPMLEAAVAAFREVQTAYLVWDAYPNIMYHPALSASQRAGLDSHLCCWWKRNWAAHQGRTGGRRLAAAPVGAGRTVPRDLLNVLTYCLRAAMSSRWSAERSALVGMWTPPSDLLSGVASIRGFMEGLEQLQFAEIYFIEALLQQDLTEEGLW